MRRRLIHCFTAVSYVQSLYSPLSGLSAGIIGSSLSTTSPSTERLESISAGLLQDRRSLNTSNMPSISTSVASSGPLSSLRAPFTSTGVSNMTRGVNASEDPNWPTVPSSISATVRSVRESVSTPTITRSSIQPIRSASSLAAVTPSASSLNSSFNGIANASVNGSLGQIVTPYPDLATVLFDGTSQVIYKETFANLKSMTSAENITTPLPATNGQASSTGAAAVVVIAVGPAGVWYRIGDTGPPIGPPDIPKISISGGRSLFCEIFPFFCKILKITVASPVNPAPLAPDPPNPEDPEDPSQPDPKSPEKPTGNGEPESQQESRTQGKLRGSVSTTMSTTTHPRSSLSTSMRSASRRSTAHPRSSQSTPMHSTWRQSASAPSAPSTFSSKSSSSVRFTTTSETRTSSTQGLITLPWATGSGVDDPLETSSEDLSAVATYLQAQYVSLGIQFEQSDYLAEMSILNATNTSLPFTESSSTQSNPTTMTADDLPLSVFNEVLGIFSAVAKASVSRDLASPSATARIPSASATAHTPRFQEFSASLIPALSRLPSSSDSFDSASILPTDPPASFTANSPFPFLLMCTQRYVFPQQSTGVSPQSVAGLSSFR